MNERDIMQRRLTVLAVLAVTALFVAVPSSAAPGTDTTALRNAVTESGIMAHEKALQQIANRNGGTRASGTTGYSDSVDYGTRSCRQRATTSQSRTLPTTSGVS